MRYCRELAPRTVVGNVAFTIIITRSIIVKSVLYILAVHSIFMLKRYYSTILKRGLNFLSFLSNGSSHWYGRVTEMVIK